VSEQEEDFATMFEASQRARRVARGQVITGVADCEAQRQTTQRHRNTEKSEELSEPLCLRCGGRQTLAAPGNTLTIYGVLIQAPPEAGLKTRLDPIVLTLTGPPPWPIIRHGDLWRPRDGDRVRQVLAAAAPTP
jgi:hypothetical protein